MLANVVQAARRTVPDDLPAFFGEQGRALGAEDVVRYLVDREQFLLILLFTDGVTECRSPDGDFFGTPTAR
jgi:serine phosphatase RsbU (regulator of sigma subunit)